MKRIASILLSALLIAPPGHALKEPPADPPAAGEAQALSNELDAFVRQALKEGLLAPPGSGKPEAAPSAPKSLRSERAEPPPAVPKAQPQPAALDCSGAYPLDFSEFTSLKHYGDLYSVRTALGDGAEKGGSQANAALARAYMALDLAPEATMAVGRFASGEGVALKYLARLLEQRGAPPSLYFSELAECYPQAGLWHGVSLLAEGDRAGAALVDAHIAAFRELPLQLRDRAAWITIPALDAVGERMLAKKVLMAFSEEEIANSAQLTFTKAVVDLGEKDPSAEEVLGTFLVQSRFEEAALSALIRHKRPVQASVRAILLDEMVTRIELAQKDADVRKDLRFVLEELGRESMYMPMIRLAELPSMQSATARQELATHLAASLERDLAGEDRLRNLAAIEALLHDPGLLDGAPQRAALYASATDAAVRLGFGTLAEALAAKAEGAGGNMGQRALLAYRQKDFDTVFKLAEQAPKDQKVQLIAAKSAIDKGEKARLSLYESRLTLDPQTVLTLIEHDAAGARWMVSAKVMNAAGALKEEDQRRRVDRVVRLRAASSGPAVPGRPTIASVPGKLNQSRESIRQMTPEAP